MLKMTQTVMWYFDSGPTIGQNKRMVNFQMIGQIKDFSKKANGQSKIFNWP